ncbi:MAG: hypothetical protein NZ518_04030 [Dehalococcoidia bacterium]|nr:hypothetical protein [Dehalococcoidia bacterium]
MAAPTTRGLLSASWWWLTTAEAPTITLLVPSGVVRGDTVVAVDVTGAPSWEFIGAAIDGQPIPASAVIPIDTTTLKDGAHTIRVGVRDHTLRRNTRWAEATLRTDNTPPQVSGTPRRVGVAQGSTALLSVRVSEPVELTLEFGGGRRITFVKDGEQYIAFLGVEMDAAVGAHPAKLVARDEAGNQAVVDTVVEIARSAWTREEIWLPPELLQLLTSGEYDQELDRLLPIYSTTGGERLWEGPFEMPARGVISSGFGIYRAFNGGRAFGQHLGVDFDLPIGTPLRAAARHRAVVRSGQRSTAPPRCARRGRAERGGPASVAGPRSRHAS